MAWQIFVYAKSCQENSLLRKAFISENRKPPYVGSVPVGIERQLHRVENIMATPCTNHPRPLLLSASTSWWLRQAFQRADQTFTIKDHETSREERPIRPDRKRVQRMIAITNL